MTDFDYDTLQKKRLARNARYKKNGSKSKLCRLPSDGLTEAQWKKRNGEVMSFCLREPMNYTSFRALPADLKSEYVTWLRDTYGANLTNISEMLGVNRDAFVKYLRKEGVDAVFPVGHRMNAEQRDAWDAFICGEEPEKAPEPKEPGCVLIPVSDTPIAFMPEAAKPPHMASMTHFSVSFSGLLNIDMIANSLRGILGSDANGEIEIYCTLKEG